MPESFYNALAHREVCTRRLSIQFAAGSVTFDIFADIPQSTSATYSPPSYTPTQPSALTKRQARKSKRSNKLLQPEKRVRMSSSTIPYPL